MAFVVAAQLFASILSGAIVKAPFERGRYQTRNRGGTMDDEKAMNAARRFALWHIGEAAWADRIIEAFRHPDETNFALDAEMED